MGKFYPKLQINEDQVTFGSGVRLSDVNACLKKIPFAQPFVKALETLGSPQIRNQATIGGSVMWNHPSSDLWPLYIGKHEKLVGSGDLFFPSFL